MLCLLHAQPVFVLTVGLSSSPVCSVTCRLPWPRPLPTRPPEGSAPSPPSRQTPAPLPASREPGGRFWSSRRTAPAAL